MEIVLFNNDPFGNVVIAIDKNNGDIEIWNGWIDSNERRPVMCLKNDSGYGNIATKIDQGNWTGRSFLQDGDEVKLF